MAAGFSEDHAFSRSCRTGKKFATRASSRDDPRSPSIPGDASRGAKGRSQRAPRNGTDGLFGPARRRPMVASRLLDAEWASIGIPDAVADGGDRVPFSLAIPPGQYTKPKGPEKRTPASETCRTGIDRRSSGVPGSQDAVGGGLLNARRAGRLLRTATHARLPLLRGGRAANRCAPARSGGTCDRCL